MNEKDQFLDDIESDKKDTLEDILTRPLNQEAPKKEETEDDEEVPEGIKNRRHKRLEAKLQAEREANIAMAARLETIAEAKKGTEDPASYLKAVERIYGTDSPEAVAATELLKSALKGVKEEAAREALETFRKEQQEASETLKKEEQTLDAMLEDIEDEFGVDLSSKKAEEIRKGFFKRLERLSPKDEDGNIREYADHRAVWEDYVSRLGKRTENRAKDISARSMANSTSASVDSKQDSDWDFLKKEFGW